MNLDWEKLVDSGLSAERSIVLRYHSVITRRDLTVPITFEDLARASMGEGVRSSPLGTYKGVEIDVIDESSLMVTGTYKDLDACLVTAIANHASVGALTLSSGGNLGAGLASYSKQHGRTVYLFHPKSTWYKFQASKVDFSVTKLISVDRAEPEIKILAKLFSRQFGILHVPDLRWRFAASAPRALFTLENARKTGRSFDYLAQTMCAGYGPVGIYSCFSELIEEGLLTRDVVPKFIGFQQEANAPMVRAWKDGAREIGASHVQPRPDQYIEEGLYNTNPGRNYEQLHDLLQSFGGTLQTVGSADYERFTPMLLDWFQAIGCELSRVPGSDELLEKTGILTGVGVLAAIDNGRILPGQRVGYLLTGGFRKTQSASTSAPLQPDAEVDGTLPLEKCVDILGDRFGLRPASPRYKRSE